MQVGSGSLHVLHGILRSSFLYIECLCHKFMPKAVDGSRLMPLIVYQQVTECSVRFEEHLRSGSIEVYSDIHFFTLNDSVMNSCQKLGMALGHCRSLSTSKYQNATDCSGMLCHVSSFRLRQLQLIELDH